MRVIKFSILLFLVSIIVACNFTEEIYFNDDNSGKLAISFDGNELMAMMGSLDSLKQDEAIDSIMVFKDFLNEKKDSIAKLPVEEQEKLKKLEPFSLHLIMKPEEQVMKFELFNEFKDVSEVKDALNTFQSATSISSPLGDTGKQGPPKAAINDATEVLYNFKDNKFSRLTRITDQKLFEQSLDSMASSEMFLSGSTYTFKYHFPRRVKKVNVEGATFSIDGKTMIYEVNFLDMMKTPEKMDIEIELED